MTYPVAHDDRVLDPINISKYSTLTNSIEYTLPATVSFSNVFSDESYNLHSFKGVNSEGEALVDLEKRIYNEDGYFSTYEVALISSASEIEITKKNAADEGELIGFDRYGLGRGNQYNLIKEIKSGESKLFVRKISENGSVSTFPIDWVNEAGEVIGVDKSGYIYYLKYNQGTNLKFPELLKYNRDMELIDSMDVYIPYNTEANNGTIWGKSFLSTDGVVYYSFSEPEPENDLWSIQRFSFSDKKHAEAVNQGPQTSSFDSELEPETEWTTYSDGSISFEYPSLLTLNKEVNAEGTTLSLTHSIDFNHEDACDMSGRGTQLNQFEEFNMSVKILNNDLANTLPEWALDNVYPEKNVLILEPGYIETYNTETLKGYRLVSTSEGCGRFFYFFPISLNKTLMVENKIINWPNSLTPLDPLMREDFFKRIFASIRI